MDAESPMTLSQARTALGVAPSATPAEVRRAFREAAKRAHPDRPGGGAEAFRQVVAAYHRLQQPPPTSVVQAPAARAPAPEVLVIGPLVALYGGGVRRQGDDGRAMRITLPAGLRNGDAVRVDDRVLTIEVHGHTNLLVRGDDLWLTATVEPRLLVEGGRLELPTPLGRRILWVTKKAGERGLVRLVGQGLPARGRHAQGDFYIRLAVRQGEAQSAARTLLHRFTAAWAA